MNTEPTINVPIWIADLCERREHSNTMRPLSPIEAQWLADWETHFVPAQPRPEQAQPLNHGESKPCTR